MDKFDIIGIDVGSVSISLAQLGPERELIQTAYGFHRGDIVGRLRGLLGAFDLARIGRIAVTGSTPSTVLRTRHYDSRVSLIAAVQRFHESFHTILFVGGEKFGALFFDEDGAYRRFKANTSCAAGTGSFLDQQATRLGLDRAEDLTALALKNSGPLPKIASRCAVFAKTDLIHAQQEGYSLPAICDGLCHGLAQNVFDTLFTGEDIGAPVIFAGGVSNNTAVVRHFESLVGSRIITGGTDLYGAIGAALCLRGESGDHPPLSISTADDILSGERRQRRHFYPPLELSLDGYPDFSGHEIYKVTPATETSSAAAHPVEVDIYQPLKSGGEHEVLAGFDVGSTSTKAVLLDCQKNVLVGFYTRTAGAPVEATKRILAAVDGLRERREIALEFFAVGITGSGRKFVGNLIGADLVLDEITAHARAALELQPRVDTIIEIGGQDAKFTTLVDGSVTFSAMNTVCAAGTGSFIEEQAQRLGCSLDEYSKRVAEARAPIISDRCTVFMERDINHFLAEGYTVEEMLASALHSVRENYLTKVARQSDIGDSICFQGATAKNRALVAAFAEKLGRPIHVSRYCHLTGALGAALVLLEQLPVKTRFRGIALYRQDIPVRREVCRLCGNHCKITVTDLSGERVAYGFLCGRDYDTDRFVDNNRSGFDLLQQRKEATRFQSGSADPSSPLIGLPSALYLHEDLPFWKKFFDALCIRTISKTTSEDVLVGKHTANAEFCAPLVALHGQVNTLLTRADYVFLPVYLDRKPEEKNTYRRFCYYSQYAPAVISAAVHGEEKRLLRPLASYLYNSVHTRRQLYKTLRPILGRRINLLSLSAAYDTALAFREEYRRRYRDIYRKNRPDDLHVVLLGRPYTILTPTMNKGIPNIFAGLGIRAFYQDMIDHDKGDTRPIRPLLDEVRWYYAAEILAVAQKIARTDGAYPVYVTSFRCSPDSFVIEYFKKLMEAHRKPYLILQLDEHNSSLGYETRIEAAVRSFDNHYRTRRRTVPVYGPTLTPKREKRLEGRTILLPNWDNIPLRMITASLRREGYDARLLEEEGSSISQSLRHNSGQCIPLNIIAREFIDYVTRHDLDPAKAVLWNIKSTLACNLPLFPHHIRHILAANGKGLEKAGVYVGSMSFIDISVKVPLDSYLAYMFGGLIRKIGCRLRPYEKTKGAVDAVIARSVSLLEDAFSGNRAKADTVEQVVSWFEAVETDTSTRRPKVAIFGDLYARDNEVINQDLVYFIEKNGGEVITTPYSDYVKMVAGPYLRKWLIEGEYFSVLSSKALLAASQRLDKYYYKTFARLLPEPAPVFDTPPQQILSRYNVLLENSGESLDNLIKVSYLAKRYPDLSLFVQTNPAFCCPSLVTEAMNRRIEEETGVPVVSVTYDGTAGNKNDIIIPYLKYSRKKDG